MAAANTLDGSTSDRQPYQGTGGVNLLNLAAFALPCTIGRQSGELHSGHPGSEGRNAFNSPNFTNFDFALTKTTHITEKLAMELRADVFNIFNHTNLSNPLMPSFGLDAFSFGSPTSSAGNRIC